MSSNFRSADWTLLRAPLASLDIYLELFGHDGDPAEKFRVILQEPAFREALFVATPSLSREIDEYLAGATGFDEKRTRQLFRSVARYAVRATTRSVPFGAFAGCCSVAFEEGAVARLGRPTEHRRTIRLAYSVLVELGAKLEQMLAPGARLVRNPILFECGERIVVPYRPSADLHDVASVKAGKLLRAVLRQCRTPTAASEIVSAIAGENANLKRDLPGYLARLTRLGVLLTTLRPPPIAADPIAHVLGELPPGSEPIRSWLEDIRKATDKAEQTPLGHGLESLKGLYRAQTEARAELRFNVTSVLEVRDARLPVSIGQAAEAAADVLALLHDDRDQLNDYLRIFSERYASRYVPVVEALDPVFGIGLPPFYEQPHRRRMSSDARPRGHAISMLLGEIAARGLSDPKREVRITKRDLATIPAPSRAPSSMDLFAALGAEDEAQLRSGNFELVVQFARCPGGENAGRFGLLDPTLRGRLEQFVAQEIAVCPDLDFVQICFVSSRPAANDVATVPQLLPFQLCVGCCPTLDPAQQIELADVLVGVQAQRFVLRSRRSGRRLSFRLFHNVQRSNFPPPIRFLVDVSSPIETIHWDWRQLGSLECLPRVRLNSTPIVLHPMRWRLPNIAKSEDGVREFERWRNRWNLPRYVIKPAAHQWLYLDLHDRTHREILIHDARRATERIGEIGKQAGEGADINLANERPMLVEAIGPEQAWLRDEGGGRHFAEVVVPLIGVPRPAPEREMRAPAATSSDAERSLLPGEGWLYFKLYGVPADRDLVLRHLATAFEDFPPWFFVRYADAPTQGVSASSGQHLRLRIRTSPETSAALLARASAAFRALRNDWLIGRVTLDTYEREIERYGGVESMKLCEDLFCRDSRLALELLDFFPTLADDAFLSYFAIDTFLWALEPDWRVRAALYDEAIPDAHELPVSMRRMLSEAVRNDRKLIWTLLSSAGLANHPESAQLVAWRQSLAELREMGGALKELEQTGALQLPLLEVQSSILHLHCNRLGVLPPIESARIAVLKAVYDGFRHHVPPGVVLE